jgi:hypothetical protein
MPIGNGGIIGPANVPTLASAKGVWSLREAQLAQRQGIWPLGVIPDPYFEYTTLLLPGNGTNGAQNNTFLDASTNNFTITRNGNTTQGTFSPFSQTGWGNYFDGNGDYLTWSGTTVGTNQFTFECWFYMNSFVSDARLIAGNINSFSIRMNSTTQITVEQAYGGTAAAFTVPTMTTGQWYHLAAVRDSSNRVTIFLNGTRSSTGTTVVTASYTAATSIGILVGFASTAFNGYISNVRLVNGSTVYDPTLSSIPVPTAPLTAVTNTALLTCQSNRFIDNSTNNFTITANGNTSVQAFSPFNPVLPWTAANNGGSGYFDGSGDYLSVANSSALNLGSSNYTIECWFYAPSAPTANDGIFTKGNTTSVGSEAWSLEFVNSSGNVGFGVGAYNSFASYLLSSSTAATLNAWNHIAVVRNGTSHTMYLNGASVATATASYTVTSAGSLYIGTGWYAPSTRDFIGYISNARLVIGTAVYTAAFTPPTAPLTAITNTSLLLNFTNAGIYDATSKNDLETVGNAQISTAISAKWGSGSMAFDGTGDYLSMPNNDLVRLGGGDFTIEFWANTTSFGAQTYTPICGIWDTNVPTASIASYYVGINAFNTTYKLGFSYFVSSVTDVAFGTATNSTGSWDHYAVVRSGNLLYGFKNGTLLNSGGTAITGTIANAASTDFRIGGIKNGNVYNGYIQDLRITKYARYTSNFTAPTAAFPTL